MISSLAQKILIGALAAMIAGALAATASAATAPRVVQRLPASLSPYGPLDYLALDGDRVVAENGQSTLIAVRIDNSAAEQLATVPTPPDPHCASSESEDEVLSNTMAVGGGRILDFGYSGCKLQDGGGGSVNAAGPFTGPFTNSGISCSSPDAQWAISAQYVVCGLDDEGRVSARAAGSSGAGWALSVPGFASLELTGGFLAIEATRRVTIVNLASGRREFSVPVKGAVSYAIGATGVLVLGEKAGVDARCTRTLRHLRWYSPAAPHRHALPYKACARTMYVRGRKLIFQTAGRNGLIAIKRGNLAGATPGLLARYSAQGALIDADREHILATDDDRNGHAFSFIAS